MENYDKKDRQMENLVNLVENHTRTERHLEQYSHIGSEDNKEHARDVQKDREEQIQDLKEKITGEDAVQTKEEQLENLEERYEKTEGYIEHNKNEMNKEDLQNIENKQENRKNQIENLKD